MKKALLFILISSISILIRQQDSYANELNQQGKITTLSSCINFDNLTLTLEQEVDGLPLTTTLQEKEAFEYISKRFNPRKK